MKKKSVETGDQPRGFAKSKDVPSSTAHLSQPNDNGGRMAEEEWKQEEESAGERTIPLTSL